MFSVMEGWPAACREEKSAFFFSGHWKIFLRGKEELLLQRLLEGQIRERKEIWAVWLLLEKAAEIFRGRGLLFGFFGRRGKKGGSFQLKRVAGCLAEGGLTKEFIQLQGAR